MRRKRPDLAPCPPDNSPIASVEAIPQVPPESKFSSSKLAEKVPRRHSFRIPDLPAIKSNSETEEDSSSSSDDPSLTTIPSAESDSAKHARRKRRRKRPHPLTARDSEDERFSGYLLSLAASAAEKQLRDQALAAYPNEHVHERVNHWAGDQDSDDDSEAAIHVGKLDVNEPEEVSDDEEDNISHSRGSRRHRESAAGWDMQEMRKHQSRLEEQKQNAWASKNDTVEPELGARRKSVAQQQQQHQQGALPAPTTAFQRDNETTTMRKAASPPMAGEDLRFPKCLSPQQTRMDVHQYPKSRGGASSKQQQEHAGLWTPGGGASRTSSQSGLWMGVNAASAQVAYASQKTIHTGLLTPALERGDPFSNSSFSTKPAQSQRSPTKSSSNLQLPPTPPSTTLQPLKTPALPSTAATDTAAGSETSPLTQTKSLAEEFPDEFVTQLYNYLSLGYPTLARPYDDELCRITRIPMEQLRKDDSSPHLNARGYIGAPEGTGCQDPRAEGGSEEKGERWLALRMYVWEWGRQQRGWAVEEAAEGIEHAGKSVSGHTRPKSEQDVGRGQNAGWGGIARKGSWAW
ncbi:MAG: hypothetical protein OHK93_002644 [Ramalina farinacea]|uniref:Uncharacterized protein n=1 Tax=Ramalina farinacea TaxID=258253 RepID=A0AA43QW86_9LECA|nr:hypothetical protein [Ramalina farinacea]